MGRFGPQVLPSAGRPLDFSPLSSALDRFDRRHDQDRREELEDADLQLKIRAAGGRPSSEVERTPSLADAIDRTPPRNATMPAMREPSELAPDLDQGRDPYAGESGIGRAELGGIHGGASASMRTATGANVGDYLRPYHMKLRGTDYTFDPAYAARSKAAASGIEEDAEIGRMRGLGMNDQDIARSKYPDRSLTFPERKELKSMDIASRAEVQRHKENLDRRRISLEERKVGLLEAAKNNSSDYAAQRMAYLRERLAFDKAFGEASLAMREYGIDAGQLQRQDPVLMDDETLSEAEREITAARKRATSASDKLHDSNRAGAPAGRTQADTARTRPTPAPRNPYRR